MDCGQPSQTTWLKTITKNISSALKSSSSTLTSSPFGAAWWISPLKRKELETDTNRTIKIMRFFSMVSTPTIFSYHAKTLSRKVKVKNLASLRFSVRIYWFHFQLQSTIPIESIKSNTPFQFARSCLKLLLI